MNDIDPAAPADFAVVDRLLSARHSVRGFRSEPVPREVIESILRASQKTASWCNTQPWRVSIASGAAIERLRAALLADVARSPAEAPDIPFPEAYVGESQARRRACGFQLYEAVGVARGDREAASRQTLENFRLFGAPHVAIITTEALLGPYGAVDCGGYVANFMTAAQSHGVATIAQAALAGRAALLRSFFGIDASRQVVCGISFGYEDVAHPANGFRTSRSGLDETVSWFED